MTSREIAVHSEKKHQHVMEAIRAMEPAWEKVNGSKFRLVEYTDAKGEKRPQYELSKMECLYIATKFNDEARARLIMRWEELEKAQSPMNLSRIELAKMVIQAEEEKAMLMLSYKEQEKELKEAAPKVEYFEKVLQSNSLIAVTQIAADLGLSALALNKFLFEKGMQFRVNGCWVPSAKIKHLDYMRSKTYSYMNSRGETLTNELFYWTEAGRLAIHDLVKLHRSKQLINSEV